MRKPLSPYNGANRINYLCIVCAELMGELSLKRIPYLMSGFNSILNTFSPPMARAVRNLRLAGLAPATQRELQLMIDNYHALHKRNAMARGVNGAEAPRIEQRYLIRDDLAISRTWTRIVPDDVTEAIHSLTSEMELRATPSGSLHDPMSKAEVEDEHGYSGIVSPLGFVPPDPPKSDPDRPGRAPGFIRWSGLMDIAKEYDAIDVAEGRQSAGENSWYNRLHDAQGNATAILLMATDLGLNPTDGLELNGIKHLIGLPGSGKTTLLFLLAGWLAANGNSACFLFPSIEVASAFIEKLAGYNVPGSLLFGQGETSRNKHVLNFATSLSTNNNGFGVTRRVAPFFSTTCALAGFCSDEDQPFPHNDPPCDRVMQRPTAGGRARKKSCALCSVCGYQYGERSLAQTKIWAGHILSIDRRVSPLFIDNEVRHFEYLARTFDLLVVDECDGAQNNLDSRGTPLTKLAGDYESLWSTLIHDLHGPAARGRNAFVAGVAIPTLLEMTGRFGRATERFVGRVMHFSDRFRKDNANILHTSLSIISDLFPIEDEEDEESQKQLNARRSFEMIWDAAGKSVAYRHAERNNEEEDDDGEDHHDFDDSGSDLDRMLGEAAKLTDISKETLSAFYDRLVLAIEVWDRDGDEAALHAIATVLKATPGLVSSLDDETFFSYSTLLVAVTLLVMQHFGLAPHLRLMNAEGLVSDAIFDSRPSRDQLAILPESLVGRLSGIRYTVTEEGNVDIAHIGFSGTPRLLPERMLELSRERGDGMAVLLTSATSLLEYSPSFHVSAGPHYVLKRPNAGMGWVDSRYRFFPKSDPQDTTRALRFSGARFAQRERILKSMADQLLRSGALSDVETAIKENDVVDGCGRKAAFIVNSYEQCEFLFDYIQANHAHWRGRIRYLVRPSLHAAIRPGGISSSDVENLGYDQNWDLLIFPMSAIGRGVNIVYKFGARVDKAMLGSLFFLTRPHPRSDSLQLIQGLVGKASEEFDAKSFGSTDEAIDALRKARFRTSGMIEHLLRMSLMSQRLGKYAEPFVADQMIMILQTIGRAMRGDCPAFVYFVDAAWAPASARGEVDTERTSMLVMMQGILSKCLAHPDPSIREAYHNLYETFSVPMGQIEGLQSRLA